MLGGNVQPAGGIHQERQRRGSYRHWQEQPHHRRLMLYSNHPAGMTFGASRTAIFGYVTERCDLIVMGGGASGGTLAHAEIDKRPKRLTFLYRPREVRYR